MNSTALFFVIYIVVGFATAFWSWRSARLAYLRSVRLSTAGRGSVSAALWRTWPIVAWFLAVPVYVVAGALIVKHPDAPMLIVLSGGIYGYGGFLLGRFLRRRNWSGWRDQALDAKKNTAILRAAFARVQERDRPGVKRAASGSPPWRRGAFRRENIVWDARNKTGEYLSRAAEIRTAYEDPNDASPISTLGECERLARLAKRCMGDLRVVQEHDVATIAKVLDAHHGRDLRVLEEAQKADRQREDERQAAERDQEREQRRRSQEAQVHRRRYHSDEAATEADLTAGELADYARFVSDTEAAARRYEHELLSNPHLTPEQREFHAQQLRRLKEAMLNDLHAASGLRNGSGV